MSEMGASSRGDHRASRTEMATTQPLTPESLSSAETSTADAQTLAQYEQAVSHPGVKSEYVSDDDDRILQQFSNISSR